jgi:hypothetical protein
VATVSPQDQDARGTAIKNSIVLIGGNSLVLRQNTVCDASIVVLPVFPLSNDSLYGTFFDLAISFKYFVLFVTSHQDEIDPQVMQEIRTRIYQLFIDSYIGESPFFFNFSADILSFMRQMLPTCGCDFVDDLPLKFFLLSVYADWKERPFIGHFLEEQQMIWDERVLLPLKSFFPEFLTPSDERGVSELRNPKWELPSPRLQWTLRAAPNAPCAPWHRHSPISTAPYPANRSRVNGYSSHGPVSDFHRLSSEGGMTSQEERNETKDKPLTWYHSLKRAILGMARQHFNREVSLPELR